MWKDACRREAFWKEWNDRRAQFAQGFPVFRTESMGTPESQTNGWLITLGKARDAPKSSWKRCPDLWAESPGQEGVTW